MSKEQMLSVIQQQGVLPLFYHDDIEVCVNAMDALYKAGIKAVEFTNRGAYALPNFKKLSSLVSQRWQGLQLGIGTILNAADAHNFIDAGAAFVVCPGTIPAVAKVVHQKGLLWIPGCMTATEIIIAKDNGATLVKIFPGSLVGPSYISAIKDIFPDLLFMPTGGVEVSENNISAWFTAGVCAVGLGSKVISKESLANKQYDKIETLIREALAMVKKVRGDL
ncbi:MAG: bifunctional 4-hydroxy-2-oxoglutarate aldolase/2-dehydro-3-deoxy-phosphogluconate aldolase [Bacteroidota bacterium]|nr:bifunctional 4-hydroxy-2-oxoglutarate aldolase/2-dehydro-3-deoxy-phosphogluconate aldolase [Bacteroidota bacterium]